MQIKFNDHVKNNTTNLNIIESEEKLIKIRVDYNGKIRKMLKEATRIHLMLE